MNISCPTGRLDTRFGGPDKAIEFITKAGFDSYDISLDTFRDDTHWLMDENWRQEIARLRKLADNCGISCNQSHAPFPSSVGDPEKDAAIFNRIVRSMEAAAMLGAKIIVVHPKQHLPYLENAKELFEMNMEFYKSLIPYCEKFGIRVAVENMWQYSQTNHQIICSTCASPDEFCEYIDAIDSEWIVGCLDIGHISLVGYDIYKFIKKMGNTRIKALHIHDTDFINDLHTVPFLQKIDYETVIKALHDIGYDGDVTFEANKFYKNLPDDLLDIGARFMLEVGKYIKKNICK